MPTILRHSPTLLVGAAAGFLALMGPANSEALSRQPAPTAATAPAPVDHSALDRVLKKFVNDQGRVNYRGLKADRRELDQYLALLSARPPDAAWAPAEQMAYWINAYNAFTLQLILDHYPLKSIKDIGPRLQIPFVNTPWAEKFFVIGGTKMSLDNIEHGILRKQYDDPRVHFALVCASISCARLRNEAYTAARLDRQLDDQGRNFMNDPAKNRPGKTAAQLSKYFDWYRGDWTNKGQSVAGWVNKYSATKMDADAKVSYLEYNWNLNEQ